MTELAYTAEEIQKFAEAIPPLQVEGGYYPVDIETTVQTGWVTYGKFVVEEEGEHHDR